MLRPHQGIPDKPKPREGGESEGHVEELTHLRVDPTFKQIDIKQAMESGVERFADSIPVLKKALNELSKIHPVVTGTSCLPSSRGPWPLMSAYSRGTSIRSGN